MAVFDANFLVYLLDPQANAPIDQTTGQPVENLQGRIEHLLSQLESDRQKIVVPAPALSEYLVKADHAGAARLQAMQRSSHFGIADFDTRAAVELAEPNRTALEVGDKKSGSEEHWQKIKFDRQIIAIAKVAGEYTIYSDDPGLRQFAETARADYALSVLRDHKLIKKFS